MLDGQLAWEIIGDAERPQGHAILVDERCPGVKSEVWFSDHERVVCNMSLITRMLVCSIACEQNETSRAVESVPASPQLDLNH